MTDPENKRVLVLGGYGLIGSACLRALKKQGFHVAGMGRSEKRALRVDPKITWLIRDIPQVTSEDWAEILADFDVVVNASGALQDGARDSLEGIHVTSVRNLTLAAKERGVRIVQISAAGVSETASTEFFRSKARGDAFITANAADWVILRPTLVLAPEAYGGTALLRAVAAIPLVRPVVLPDAKVQTVHIDDVADAVVLAARGDVPSGTIADLTEPGSQSFADLVLRVRYWQGWPRPTLSFPVPNWMLGVSGKLADVTGALGWRSPLRTTAIRALQDGIEGDSATWPHRCRPLAQSLQDIPATRQERLYARAFLALPLAIVMLSLFWLLSGIIGVFEFDWAQSYLTDRGVSLAFAALAVIAGIFADIALGLAILWRGWTRWAALGMILVSVGYLLGASIVAPDLWADPLGPMIKVIPGIALALIVWMMVEDE